jgi:hypothetical protein
MRGGMEEEDRKALDMTYNTQRNREPEARLFKQQRKQGRFWPATLLNLLPHLP